MKGWSRNEGKIDKGGWESKEGEEGWQGRARIEY